MNLTKENRLLLLAVGSAGVLLISNLAATKLWDFFGIAVDGGILIFPLSYIINDIIVELYGQERAKLVVLAGFGLNLLAVLTFLAVSLLPDFPGWEGGEAFLKILGFAPRIMLGSLVAYVSSKLLNNHVFMKIKQRTKEDKLVLRLIGSSMVGRIVDVVVFETIAFFGVLAPMEFMKQMTFAYASGMILEIALTPVTCAIIKRLKKG